MKTLEGLNQRFSVKMAYFVAMETDKLTFLIYQILYIITLLPSSYQIILKSFIGFLFYRTKCVFFHFVQINGSVAMETTGISQSRPLKYMFLSALPEPPRYPLSTEIHFAYL